MTFIVQSNATKRLYKTTNICILLFTVTWLILSIILLFNNETVELLTDYLMLFSATVFLLGSSSAVITTIIDKTREVSEDEVRQLLLNIDQKDYEKSNFTNILPNNNFVVVQNFNHEINSVEALMLLKIAKDKGIEVKLTQQAYFTGLDQRPKDLFNDCIGILWGTST